MAGLVRVTSLVQLVDAARRGTLAPAPPADGSILPPRVGKVVSQILVSDVKSHITGSTSADSTRFRPLKHPRPNGGDIPLRDTGVLLASIHPGYDGSSVWAATTHPGAALQNFGGVVRAKGKMLAIPLTREAKRAGSPRRFPRELGFRPTKKNRVFLLVDKVGRKQGQFLLVDSVTVPAREFMGVSEKALTQIGQVVLEAQARGWLEGT